MDFFQHQERARRNTALLILYFVLAVAAIVAAVNGIVLLTLAAVVKQPQFSLSLFGPGFYRNVTCATLTIIGLGTIYKLGLLRRGGAAVAEMVGGRLVSVGTQAADERKLMNVVEEMALASGMSVPPVYVFPDDSINAFAAGYKPENAVVAVSRGAMSKLNRDELQGVIAHEFSHIFNGDMRLNIRLIGLLHGILALAVVGHTILRNSGRARVGGKQAGPLAALALIALGLMAVGYIGVFFSRLIKSAISRQREFLADASSVQFTRNPRGILGALLKIRRNEIGSKIDAAHAEEVSHMLFAAGFGTWMSGLFATHPPLEERIRAIDPGGLLEEGTATNESRSLPIDPAVSGFAGSAGLRSDVSSSGIAQLVGNPTGRDVEQAVDYRASLPAEVTSSLGNVRSAEALIYALLLSDDEAIRTRQLDSMSLAGDVKAAIQRFDRTCRNISLRLPLVELAMPALRTLAHREREAFLDHVHALITEDNRILPFEFAVETVLRKNLLPPPLFKNVLFRNVDDGLFDGICLLSFLAYAGANGAEEKAAEAFRRSYVFFKPGRARSILPWDHCGYDRARMSLERLSQAVPEVKRRLIEAAGICVLADQKIEAAEWETLRAFATALECPIPLSMPVTAS